MPDTVMFMLKVVVFEIILEEIKCVFLRTKELMLPGVRSSLGASFLSSPCVLAATTA